MKNRNSVLFALVIVALQSTTPSVAGVVLNDWMAPPHLGSSPIQSGSDPAKPAPQTDPATSASTTTEVVNSTSQIEIVLPPDVLNDPPIAPVPEPSTWAMLILGFAGVALLTYRRRRIAARIT